MNKNSITVFYTPWSNAYNVAQQHFLGRAEIYSLSSDFIKKRNKNLKNKAYQSCTAFRESSKNIYFFKQPLSTYIKFDDHGNIVENNDYQYYINRESSLLNCFSCDFDFGWIFYSEESLVIKWTDTYMHNTTTKQFGFLNSGSFDISRWFRPLNLTYHLWENVKEFKTEKDDPAAYIEFLTDKEIILKPFLLTQEIINISKAGEEIVKNKSNQSLSELYNIFIKNNLKTALIKEIKNNIIE